MKKIFNRRLGHLLLYWWLIWGLFLQPLFGPEADSLLVGAVSLVIAYLLREVVLRADADRDIEP
jgi:hypothetical protein